jgi:hypothetical protein
VKVQSLTTAQSFLSESYINEDHLSAVEADKKAAKDIDEIRPAVTYITESANVFALRPLLMFDLARLDDGSGTSSPMEISVGGGIQLMVVTARFEAGYMGAVRGSSAGNHGRFVFRLVFTNLF